MPRHAGANRGGRHPQPRNENGVVPESQRFFPSFNNNPPQRGSHLHNSFFNSDPHSSRRGGGVSPFVSRRPSFRSHGGGREANNKPKFAFASNKFNDFGPVDNSILGSGNFEIIKGGTFYDEKNPHRNHYPYDPYLDNSYVVFPHGNTHSHNHVDDFFSNFRDFSEFATRRSGTVQNPESGFASEQIAHISPLNDLMTSESDHASNATKVVPPVKFVNVENLKEFSTENPSQIVIVINKNNKNKAKKPVKSSKLKKNKFISLKKQEKQKKVKKPKNIQEVLEEIDPFPRVTPPPVSHSSDEDPLIATY